MVGTPRRSNTKIINLIQYDVVFTTSFGAFHGLSGHLYEMIDYFHVCWLNNIKCALLLSDGTTIDMLLKALDKYDFTEVELAAILGNTVECCHPLIIRANNLCVVDGSAEFRMCTVYCDNLYFLRCSFGSFELVTDLPHIKNVHVLQDFLLYPDRFEHLNLHVIDYVKKIMWKKYKQPKQTKTNTALLYLTTNCRALPASDIKQVIDRHSFDHYLIVTNNPSIYAELNSDAVRVQVGPVPNIFEQFDAYIYTPLPLKADCSPRFIVECAVFGKDVIYELDYIDPGIECRKRAIETDVNTLHLDDDDFFVEYFKQTQ